MVVTVAVAVAGAVHDHGVVEEIAVAFLHRLEALEEISEVRRMEDIDVLDLRHLLWVVTVVGEVVVTLAHVDERV